MYDTHLAPQLLEANLFTIVYLAHCSTPGVEAVELCSLFKHGFSSAAEATSEEAPQLRLQLPLLSLVDEQTHGEVEGLVRDFRLVMVLGLL